MKERQVVRGFLANLEVIPPLVFTFQFNPDSLSDNKQVNYQEEGGSQSDGATKQFVSGGNRTISFSFELHGLEQGLDTQNPSPIDNGITIELAKLRSFLYPRSDAWAVLGNLVEGMKVVGPPTCFFGFGPRVLECQLTNMTITETQFNSALSPVRAEVSVELSVIEERGNALHELERQRRLTHASRSVQNVAIF